MDIRKLTLVFGALAIAVAVGVSGLSILGTPRQTGEGPAGGMVGGPFSLVDHEGLPVQEADFRGRHMLIFFGYTSCPDVCPTALLVISEALDLVGPLASEVRPVFVTVDPERDTPSVLADYRRHFHTSLVTLTGTPKSVAAAAKAYNVFYAKAPGDDADDYLMDHSASIFLIDGRGRYVTRLRAEAGPEAMAARLREAL
ncbi:MAG: SCO family protein [Alphaproteobacteria bacterium]|jgi:protein SCO1/2|nr:SCO family protein [Alphaproteobacteria bacterium]